MRKITLCLFALVLSLSLFGCKNDVFNASITEVFYTRFDPAEVDYNLLIHADQIMGGLDYFMVVDFHQPNKDVVRLIMQYESDDGPKELAYPLTPKYENQISWWEKCNWKVTEDEKDQYLTFYLEDEQGRRSNPYQLKLDFKKFL